jgi:mannose-6-phosphate isomerase-like protein (cupin superfamily)
MAIEEYQAASKINSASCDIIMAGDFENGVARKPVMSGEVDSFDTFCARLQGSVSKVYLPNKKMLRVLIFTQGAGMVMQGGLNLEFDGLALFVPYQHRRFIIASRKEPLSYLEIVLHLNNEDLGYLDNKQERFPYFVRYAECRLYDEDIKSADTVSRIILPEDVVPRLCVGSVQTRGPDKVGVHAHPMLEQFFLGLPGNDIQVVAGSDQVRFRANELLHIPLGSSHGAKVAAGRDLHYIWIDLFHSIKDMDYITNSHILKDES